MTARLPRPTARRAARRRGRGTSPPRFEMKPSSSRRPNVRVIAVTRGPKGAVFDVIVRVILIEALRGGDPEQRPHPLIVGEIDGVQSLNRVAIAVDVAEVDGPA